MIRLYDKFGFTVYEMEQNDKEDVYLGMKPAIVTHKNQLVRSRQKRIISKEINYTFEHENYFALAIYRDDILVGSALVNINNDRPWIGHLNILDRFKKSKATIVFMHYILNILFNGLIVQVGKGRTKSFKKCISNYGRKTNYVRITDEAKQRFAQIIEKG